MDPITMAAIFGGGGLLKSLTLDKAKEDRQRKLAAETARYSPWTGMTPNQIQEADPFGSTLQFGTTGAMLGQGLQNQEFQQSLQPSIKEYWSAMARNAGGALPLSQQVASIPNPYVK